MNRSWTVLLMTAGSLLSTPACGGGPSPASNADAAPCSVSQVWSGFSETWAKSDDGRYWTWGQAGGGTIETGPYFQTAAPTPFMQTVLSDTSDLVVRSGISCFLSSTSVLRCTYDGIPIATTRSVDDVATIAVGPSASSGNAILRTDGSVWGFADEIGQLTTQVTTIGTDVVTLAAGQQRLCAIKRDGSVWCWGVGYLGDNHDAYPATDPQDPKPVTLPMTAMALEAGVDWTCALLSDGSVWCWGSTGYGSAARSTPPDLAPAKIQIEDVRAFSMGAFHACALKSDGSLWCWGSNFFGESGYAPDGYASADFWDMPTQVDALGTDVVEVSAGYQHTCALRSDHTVWCWGNSFWGQAGNDKVDNPAPVVIRGCD